MDFVFGPLPPRAEREAAKAAQPPRAARLALDVVLVLFCGFALFALSAILGWHSFVPDRFQSFLAVAVAVAALAMNGISKAIRNHYARRHAVMVDR